MPKISRNIYAAARDKAGLTQEQAVVLLGVSIRTLSDWENGFREVPDKYADKMATEYPNEQLRYMHTYNNDVARKCLPEIPEEEMPLAVLQAQREINGIPGVLQELVELAADGVITPEEKPRWKLACCRAKKAAGALLGVAMFAEGSVSA